MSSSALDSSEHWFATETLAMTAGAHVLVGVASIALGILALVGMTSMTLVLLALLSLGAAAVIQGSALGGTLLAIFR
jgi:hypothetical protein